VVLCKWLHCDLWPFPQVSDPGPSGPFCFYILITQKNHVAGGIIEASPPSDSITTLTVDILIEPNGNTSIISCGDQIHADSPYSCWGVSVPQSSVEPLTLNKACFRIADACKSRGIMGYFAVDFVTFIDPTTVSYVNLSLFYWWLISSGGK